MTWQGDGGRLDAGAKGQRMLSWARVLDEHSFATVALGNVRRSTFSVS